MSEIKTREVTEMAQQVQGVRFEGSVSGSWEELRIITGVEPKLTEITIKNLAVKDLRSFLDAMIRQGGKS